MEVCPYWLISKNEKGSMRVMLEKNNQKFYLAVKPMSYSNN